MKKGSLVMIGLAAMGLGLWGCNGGAEKKAASNAGPAPAMQTEAGQYSGTVLETMESGGYTYVKVDTGKEQIWAAGPQTAVKVGEKVVVPTGMPMYNFHSKSLERDFEVIYFVGAIMKEGEAASAPDPAGAGPDMGLMPPGHPSMGMGAPSDDKVEVKAGSIKKATGGKTVAEVFQEKAQLAGKQVTIRAKVVKFTPEIMDKNWLHIQDGTGAEGTNDLTVTTSQKANKGDTVLVTGTLAIDKDFGYGYRYDLILEDATVKAE